MWEWTSSTFLPYPGFVRDPYKEYSEPWFGTHKVLRGASFATPPGVSHARFRNFYTPERADMFVGLRTCAAVSVLTSRDNPKVKHWAKLARDARYRRTEKRALIEGPHLLAAALQHGYKPVAVLATEEARGRRRNQPADRADAACARSCWPKGCSAPSSDAETPQGVAAEIGIPDEAEARRAVAHRVPGGGAGSQQRRRDHAQRGGVRRRQGAPGPRLRRSLVAEGLRAGMGGHFALQIDETRPTWPREIDAFKGTVACTVPRGGVPLGEAPLSGSWAWIFGAEGRGLSEETIRRGGPAGHDPDGARHGVPQRRRRRGDLPLLPRGLFQ